MSDFRSSSRRPSSHPPDALIAAIAVPQGGHITSAQLYELGMTPTAIYGRVQRGTLHHRHRCVYAVGHLPTNPVDRAKGALLATGPRSALGLGSAAAFWELFKEWRYPLEVLTVKQCRVQGIRIHRTSTLTRADVWTPEPNLRVTSPARTLFDISPRIRSDDRLRWLLENLRVRRLIEVDQLAGVAARNPRHPAAGRINDLIGRVPTEPDRSFWETEWPPFAEHYGIPEYDTNVFIDRCRVDVLILPLRLVIWLDGWGTHGLKHKFEEDRAEANELLAEHGIPSVRITYDQFHRTPDRAAGWVLKALTQR